MKIAVLQMTSMLDYQVNLKKVSEACEMASEQGAEHLFLPECFYSMSDGQSATPYLVERDNEHYKNIQNLAREHGIYLLGGSAATREGENIYNRAWNFSPAGEDLGHYDKMHLFSCDLPKADRIEEADIYTPGNAPKIVRIGPMNVGLGVCFDLRYPEQARDYARNGANLLTFASAFTRPTGRAHWHILVRARAIENQCFVVAAAQCGRHNERIATYGHSLVVDPWGEILAEGGEEEDLLTANIAMPLLDSVRKKVKVF